MPMYINDTVMLGALVVLVFIGAAPLFVGPAGAGECCGAYVRYLSGSVFIWSLMVYIADSAHAQSDAGSDADSAHEKSDADSAHEKSDADSAHEKSDEKSDEGSDEGSDEESDVPSLVCVN